MTIGERVRIIRETIYDKKISTAKFAESLGITASAVNQWENGDKGPSNTTIALICSRYGVNEEWLRTGNGEMLSPKTLEEEIADITSRLYHSEDDPLRLQIVQLICDMNIDELKALEKIRDFIKRKVASGDI